MTESSIGFIGLGNMGGRMTRCITAKGIEVIGFDAHAPNIEAAGASPASSAADVTKRADTIFLSLPDSAVVEAVVLGADGILAHAREGQIIVDLSTASPESTRNIAAALAAKGSVYLDAGISGGAAAAEKGTLTLMVGGEESALDQVRPALAHFASNVFYMGASGTGHTTKLLNNFLNAVALSATSEVMIAGRRAGLDMDALLGVLNTSSGVNFATLNRFPKIVHGDYLKGGLTNSLMMKDVLLYTELIADLGVAGLHASGPLASFGAAVATGRAADISNTVVDVFGDLSGGSLIFRVAYGCTTATRAQRRM
jgi:3-hydroxyisobutyrate dehydrogenase